MKKIEYKGEISLYTCPTVLVTSKNNKGIDNVFTVSWAGIASSHPEYVTIAINTKRLSHLIIEESKKFCINIPSSDLVDKVDYCGLHSGREVDKFKECGFDKIIYDSDYILIKQCQMHLLCDVDAIISLGSHDLFIAKVYKKVINDYFADVYKKANPIVYFRPYYYEIKETPIGYYGFTSKDAEK